MKSCLKALMLASATWLGCTEMGELSANTAPQEGLSREEQQVVGGTASMPFTNPWHVRIQREGEEAVCNGALISLGWVVTTARCVEGADPSLLRITVGTIYRNSSRDGVTAQTFTPRQVFIHPSYTHDLADLSGLIDYDIALIELPTPVVPNTVASPIALSHTDPAAGRTCDLSGFGMTGEEGSLQTVLRHAYLNVLPRRACKAAYGNGAITHRQMCAGVEEGGRGGCQGDSGAPMVSGGYPPKLVGLYSYSRGCAQQGVPDVMTNIFAFADWIDSVTGLPL
ncbi:MAG: serine protease [Cystobacter sp.]